MDWKDMKNASPEALNTALEDAHVALRHLRSQLSANQLKDVREVREVRRKIAQIKTLLATRAKTA